MTEPSRAVFLSYASQDAEEAGRICMALRAADIEVWFDQSELRGGDAWDQLIRRRIRDRALFVPIISAHTQIRTKGYFRLEWHLADQRKLLMTKSRPFLVPVCIDATSEADAEVPDSFGAVQWTRLPEGQTTTAFVDRILGLLSLHRPITRRGTVDGHERKHRLSAGVSSSTADDTQTVLRLRARAPKPPRPDSNNHPAAGSGTGVSVPSNCTSAKRQLPELLLYAAGLPAITDEAEA
jgi:hypothetical protein